MTPKSLVRLRIFLYSAWALFNAWVTGMTDVVWNSMGWEQQSCLICGILMSWTGMLVAFFDKSVWKLDEARRNGGVDKPGQTHDGHKQ